MLDFKLAKSMDVFSFILALDKQEKCLIVSTKLQVYSSVSNNFKPNQFTLDRFQKNWIKNNSKTKTLSITRP